MINPVPRPELLRQLSDGLARSPILTILGPRQCGKTTLAREYCRNRKDVLFLDSENPADATRLTEPLLYLEKQTLDEMFVVTPRPGDYPLAPNITVCGISEAIATL
jgi:predicted AAA+ superfamily ATPase